MVILVLISLPKAPVLDFIKNKLFSVISLYKKSFIKLAVDSRSEAK
jgi:hypothetical protein